MQPSCYCMNAMFIFYSAMNHIIQEKILTVVNVTSTIEQSYIYDISTCFYAEIANYDCNQGLDMEFGIQWKGSRKNLNVSRVCPNGTGMLQVVMYTLLMIMW